MAISIFGTPATAATSASTGSTLGITVPAGTASGHVCVLAISSTGAGTQTHSVSTEAGTWTSQLVYASDGATNPSGLSLWTLVPGSAVGGTAITITVNVAGSITAALVTFAGVDTGTPVDVALPAVINTTAAGNTITMPGLTPVTANAWYLGVADWRSSTSASSTATASSTVDAQAADSNAGATNIRTGVSVQHLVWTSGAIASQTVTLTTSTNFGQGAGIALRPAAATSSSGADSSFPLSGLLGQLRTIPGSIALLQPAAPPGPPSSQVNADPATATVATPAASVNVPADPAQQPLTGLLGPLVTIPGTAVLLQPQAQSDPASFATVLVPPAAATVGQVAPTLDVRPLASPATATVGQVAPTLDVRPLTDPATATAGQVTPTLDVRLLTSPAAATVTNPLPSSVVSGDPAVFPLIGLLGKIPTIPGSLVILKPQDMGDPPSFATVLAPPAAAVVNQPATALDVRVSPTPGAATVGQPTVSVTAVSALTLEPYGSPLLAVAGSGLFIPGSLVRLKDQSAMLPASPGGGSQIISVPPAGATVSPQNLAWFKRVLDEQLPAASGTTTTLTIPADGVPVGDTVLVAVEWSTITRTLNSVTDTRGNTYTIDVTGNGANLRAALVSTRVTTALQAGDVITMTMSGVAAGRNNSALQYGGLLSSYVDTPASGSAVDQTTSPASVTGGADTAQENELVVALLALDFNASAASIPGLRERVNQASSGTIRTVVVADTLETAAGTKSWTGQWTGTVTGSVELLATYKASTGVGGIVIPGVKVAPVPRTTTVSTPAAQVFWPTDNLIIVPPATALVRQPIVNVNNVGVATTLNEVIRPTQYHQAPLQTYSQGVAVVAGQFTFSSAYQTGGDAFILPPAFQAAVVVSFHPVGGYVFEYTGSTVKAYKGGSEVAFGTPLNGLGPVPYIAYVVRGQ